jgi:hypothetical protein
MVISHLDVDGLVAMAAMVEDAKMVMVLHVELDQKVTLVKEFWNNVSFIKIAF